MEGFFNVVGAILAGLFMVAVAVAWWEHVRQAAGPPPPPAEPHKPLRVDVDVEHLEAPAGDAGERQRTLEGALNRASSVPSPWVETTPTVAAGALAPTPEATTDRH
ncbi:MAG: hypothetical protein JNM33_01600 [Rubrivivax sp.]|nr:hypothetical protein [Rubrivivax sp.]